jgi:hypothetical protein
MDFFVRQGAHHSDSRRYRADVQRRMAEKDALLCVFRCQVTH